MDKKPYVQLHVSNFLKDTRVLPPHVLAVAFQLFLYISHNDDGPGKPIKGTAAEFARLVGCSYTEICESMQLIQQQNIFTIKMAPGQEMTSDSEPGIVLIMVTAQNKSYAW
jgi:hypothetical protein